MPLLYVAGDQSANELQTVHGVFQFQASLLRAGGISIRLHNLAQSPAQHVYSQVAGSVFVEDPLLLGTVGSEKQFHRFGNFTVGQVPGSAPLLGENILQMRDYRL